MMNTMFEPTFNSTRNIHYSVRSEIENTIGQEIIFERNEITLNENKFGLLDYYTNDFHYLEYTEKPYNFLKPIGEDPYND